MNGGVCGLDLAPTLCGYAVGDGSRTPYASAWRLADHGPDLGAMACELEDYLALLHTEWQFTVCCYEAPIHTRYDQLLKIRRIYGLGVTVERWCRRTGVRCIEADLRTIKRQLAGQHDAGKSDMVAAALRAGVDLPKRKDDGREDAADAFGAWLVGMADHDPARWAQFYAGLWKQRGALV